MFMISLADKNRIYYLYLYCLSTINFQFSYYLAGFLDIFSYTRHNGGLGTAKSLNSGVEPHDEMCSMSNKQRYWMALTLVRPNSVCVGVAQMDLFMKP